MTLIKPIGPSIKVIGEQYDLFISDGTVVSKSVLPYTAQIGIGIAVLVIAGLAFATTWLLWRRSYSNQPSRIGMNQSEGIGK